MAKDATEVLSNPLQGLRDQITVVEEQFGAPIGASDETLDYASVRMSAPEFCLFKRLVAQEEAHGPKQCGHPMFGTICTFPFGHEGKHEYGCECGIAKPNQGSA